jgi:hypothetical protein
MAFVICKPSRRRAASSIQKPRYGKGRQSGAKHVAKERGLIVVPEKGEK